MKNMKILMGLMALSLISIAMTPGIETGNLLYVAWYEYQEGSPTYLLHLLELCGYTGLAAWAIIAGGWAALLPFAPLLGV
jgi:hypothetical protein